MWYSVIRWGRAPLNALTFSRVAGLATAVYTAPKSLPITKQTRKSFDQVRLFACE
jgi:hypothetical protein